MPMYLDLHVHTSAYSRCSTLAPDAMAVAAKLIGLDGVCVTEHNRMWKETEVRSLAKKHGIAIFRGMEISTTGGDVLVFGLEREPRQMWTPTVRTASPERLWPDIPETPLFPLTPAALKWAVDSARGVAIAAHPFRRFRVFGVGDLPSSLNEAMSKPLFSYVHGLEVCNGSLTDEENALALRVAEALGLLKFGGSDAHTAIAVGTCVTRFDTWIHNERDFVEAILAGCFVVEHGR